MKDIIKYGSLMILIVFSFYYTDKITNMIIYESDLMKEIISNKKKEEIPYENAIISGNFITPGLNGLEINELDSYYQMKQDYFYSSKKLVFNEVEPDLSIEKNKHLIINRGNENKKGVAIIIDNNYSVEKYLKSNNIQASKLISYEEFSKESVFEQLNFDEENMSKLDTVLNKYKLNTNICFVVDSDKKYCDDGKKYLVSFSYEVSNQSIAQIEVNSGDIVFINNNLSLANFKHLLKKIYYRDLDIIYLSNLISEKRNENG